MNIPVALYVHLPWCVKKCPYCDFNSHALQGALEEEKYIHALIRDWQESKAALQGRHLHSIFFGGGTPSLFSARAIEKLLAVIAKDVPLADVEITLEANPGTIERGRFAEYKHAGINRISLGVQSFNEKHLKILGRIHDGTQARRAIDELHASDLCNFNIDIMHGLPEQSVEEALSDLEMAISLNPAHLSWYQLTLEPHTLFYVKPPILPDEDVLEQVESAGRAALQQAGFLHYEVSAYAKDGARCRHNLNYWQFGDYIGIGAGAHGKITDLATGIVARTIKQPHPKLYLSAASYLMKETAIDPAELPVEFMMNALRLNAGLSKELFETRTGLSFAVIEPSVQQAVAKKLLINTHDAIRPSALGLRYLNDLIHLFTIA